MIHNGILLFFSICYILIGVIASSGFATSLTSNPTPSNNNKYCRPKQSPPIVYTIAGSDSGGGAGIQADLHAIHAMGCLTAQNSKGVTDINVPPAAFLKKQLDSLRDDLSPRAIKIGMLGTRELAEVVGDMLKEIHQEKKNKVWIVVDPVMISTSGSKLLDDDAVDAMIEHIFPFSDIITPNKFEAEALLRRKLKSPSDVEIGARELLKLGCRSVLIKGGHTLLEESSSSSDLDSDLHSDLHSQSSNEIQSTLEYSQDYLISSDPAPKAGKERMCDTAAASTMTKGVWIRSIRWESPNTHGTGCTLSSAIASALAIGEDNRSNIDGTKSENNRRVGATSAIHIVDACCLAKAYVSAGIQRSVRLGSGPGPVAQTEFPCSWENFPTIAMDPTSRNHEFDSSDFDGFCKMKPFSSTIETETKIEDKNKNNVLGRILPIVDTVEQVKQLSQTPGVTDIQLRIKDETDSDKITKRVQICQEYCKSNGVNLWVNDFWEEAIEANCFGVHVGQEDLLQCVLAGGLDRLKNNRMALGVSTHSYGELAVALGVQPTYISMGPVFATSSKTLEFDPQGLDTVRKWRQLIPPYMPFVTIGGINNVESARGNREAGADCIAVISAITQSNDAAASVKDLNAAMEP
jgi:hydroxymethylpyrimidine kinase/phosphomethylpyrimidine kinase/thiamine-phosphate diphosphorylase